MTDGTRPELPKAEADPSEPVPSALLDQYWNELRHRPEPDPHAWLIDRDVSDESIAGDLDLLGMLHRARGAARGDSDGSRAAIARSPEAEARAEDDRTEPPARAAASRWIGRYLVIDRLDTGGQAQVFRVVHPSLRTELVLKLALRPLRDSVGAGGDPIDRDELRREGRLMAGCDHANMVRVFDLDFHEGRPFVVMEYVPGLTLEQFAAQRRQSPRRSARLVVELARTVAYLQTRGIVHQDITPRNILIDESGRPRLIDFGLARQRHAWSEDAADWSGGTAGYMSPEQAQGRSDRIGPRTDVFGLGGVLYHLLTGRPLYQGTLCASVLRQARKGGYYPAHEINPRVPRALERILDRSLAADPERRYRTAGDLDRAH